MEELLISFSGGQSSAYMTNMLLEQEKRGEVKVKYIIFCNTGKEHEATLQFVENCSEYWGREIIWLEYAGNNKGEGVFYNVVNYKTASRKGEPFAKLIAKKGFLPKSVMRFCTQYLKIYCIEEYLKAMQDDGMTQAIGIRKDEPSRYYRISQQENKFMPLFKAGVTKQIVDDFWEKMPFKLNIPNRLGNCDFCFLKSIRKRIEIAREHPEIPVWWKEQEELQSHNKRKPSKKLSKLIESYPEHFEFINSAKKRTVKATFDEYRSVADILKLANSTVDIDGINDIDIDCHCTID